MCTAIKVIVTTCYDDCWWWVRGVEGGWVEGEWEMFNAIKLNKIMWSVVFFFAASSCAPHDERVFLDGF